MSETYEFVMCLVPHGKKMAVKDLPKGSDYTDPPLTEKAKTEAGVTTATMEERHGPPSLVVVSTKLRAQQTAEPAVAKFVKKKDGVPLLTLDCFGQPDSGDHDPENPLADHRGLVIYGPGSSLSDWWDWFLGSIDMVARMRRLLLHLGDVWGFSHRPFAAMARWISRHGMVQPTAGDDFRELDPDLFPYLRLRVCYNPTEGSLTITELPRE